MSPGTPPTKPTPRSHLQAAALALQAPLLASLAGLSLVETVVLLLIWALLGAALLRCAERSAAMADRLDMLALPNLGMLLGWSIDHGFGPATASGCHGTAAAPGMWLGMVVGGLLAGGGHRSLVGQAAMVAGMAAGGAIVAPLGGGPLVHFAGMTAGMIAAMQALHLRAGERAADARRSLPMPAW